MSRGFLAGGTPVSSRGGVPVDVPTDAFGRVRVAEPATIFDSKQIVDSQPLHWDDAATSGAGTSSTHNTNQASTTIAVSNLTAGVRVRQTKRWFNYQPGKSQLSFMTFVLGAAATGITRRLGQFMETNGVFLEQTSAGLFVVVRSSTTNTPVDTRVPQAEWNLDTMDGHGASGVELDPTKTQILIIDYEWLGVGSVRFGFVVDGTIYYCHQFRHANSLLVVYMGNPNLPLRYEIENSGTGPAAGMVHICAQISSEGGQQLSGLDRSISRNTTPLTTLNDAGVYCLIAIRLKSTHRHGTVVPRLISLICTSTAAYRWALIMNPTVTGTALVFSAVTDSPVEADIVKTSATKLTGGVEIASGFGQAQSTGDSNLDLKTNLTLGSTIAGVSDVLALAVQRISGTTESFYGSLWWHEEV